MVTRGLLVAHDVILAFALQALHNVVNNAKIHVVETSSTSAFPGDFSVKIDQLLDSKSLLEEFFSPFLLPKVVLQLHSSHSTFVCITRVTLLDNHA